MANGQTIYTGRAVTSIFGGRALSNLQGLGGQGLGTMPGPASWPRTGAMCAPIQQCCCKGPWTIAPGETQPLIMDWSPWVTSALGCQINKVDTEPSWDMNVSPPAPAPPGVIKIVSGMSGDPEPPNNSEAAALLGLIPPYGVQALIEVGEGAAIGAQYRLSLCLIARDCDGRKIKQCDCVVITIAEC